MAVMGLTCFTARLQDLAPLACIANPLWCLDICFREDHCRVRKDHAPENLAIPRHMAINLFKREKSLKGGIQTRLRKAAWDPDYLLKIFGS